MASIEERLKRMRNGAGAQKSSSTTVSSKTQKANTKDIQSRLNAMRNSSTPSAYAYSDRAGAIKWEPSSREEKKQLDTARSDAVGRIVPGMMDVRTGGILPRETSKTQPVTIYAQAVSDEERMNSLRQRAASATEATDDEDEILRMAREDPAGLREKIAERVSMSSEAEDLYRKLYPNSGVIDTAKGMGEGLKIGVTKQFPASMAGLATGVHESVGTFLNMINTPVKDGKVEYEDYISPLRDDALRLKEAADAASLANLEGRGPASARLVGVSQAAGNMLPGAAVGGIGGAMTGGALSGLSTALISAGAGGSSYLDAIQQGAGVGEAAAYGILSGATEYFTERLFGGNPLVDTRPGLVNQVVKKLGGSQKLLSFLASQPVETLNEGLEEAISEILNPVWQRLTYDPNADFATLEQIIDSAIDGVLLAGFMQGGSAVVNRALQGRTQRQPISFTVEPTAAAAEGMNVSEAEPAASPVAAEQQAGDMASQIAQKEADIRNNALASAKSTMGERGYATFEKAMRDDIDPAVYYRELTRAYNEGLASADRTGSNVVTKVQYDEMYKAGQDDAMASLSAQVKNAGNATTFKNGGIDYADADTNAYVSGAMSKETAKVLDTVSKALGIKVRFADSVAGGDANAQYANGVVTIEKNNPNPVRFLFSHEITHRMQVLAPAEYARLKASIFSGEEWADASIKEVQDMYARNGRSISSEDALDESVANYIGTLLENSGELERFIEKHRTDRTLLEKLRDVVRDIVRKLKGADRDSNLTQEQKRLKDVENRLSETLDASVKQAKKNAKAQKNTTQESGGEVKHSFKGYAPDGRGIYESNFPKGTPKSAKGQRILQYIQNVWSKKPISLVIHNADGSTRTIQAQFDPSYDEKGRKRSDATKLMGGNRHGTAGEQRVTLDLADDYYQIASEATYNYSKTEEGKGTATHEGVKEWHYFINDILFQEYGETKTTPYRVTINVKERSDGSFVYSFNAEKQNERPSTRRTLHADVTHTESGVGNAQPSGDTVAQKPYSVKIEKAGVSVDSKTESAYPGKLSLKTWNESSYVRARKEAAADMAKALDITQDKASAYIDSVNSIAKMIADDRTRLDYEASPGRSSFVSNAEYGGSIDFSTICKKRRLFTGTFEAIQRALPNTALTAEEFLGIRNMMAEKGYEVSCGLCYVEGSRANMGQYTKQFIERYKATNPEYVPNMAEMNTATGQEKLRREHPEVYEAYEYFMNHYGRLKPSDKAIFASQQKPKMYQLSTEYNGEILNKFGKKGNKVDEKNRNGGLRIQSFSDFEIIHLIDSMQVIMDMSRVGLAGQAYTKVPDFAWALGDTGLKINLSLIAKGIDKRGRLVLDETEGMKESDAMALRERYSENVGTIVVVFTDVQLKAAMADERIDYIIPFHRSQWKTDQYDAMGLPKNAKDFTPWQNEAYIAPVYNSSGKKQRPDNYMPNTYWDFSKTGKENAEAYLKMCAENNRRPKFHYLLVDNKDGSYSLQPDGSTDGYWKTLIDFKMYDNDGKGVPQRPVRPEFNMDQAQRMLNEYNGDHSKFPAAQDVVDEFVSKYKSEHEGAKFSLKDSDSLSREIARIQKDGAKNKRSDADIQADVRAVVQEAYQNMVSEYGAIRTGETPAREVQVPKRTAPNNRVSQTVRTVMEAGATPDEALPTIEEMTARGDFSYEVYGDEKAIQDARDYIGESGWDEAQRKWFNDVRSGNVSKRNTTIGWLLYDNAVNTGNTALAMDVLSAMVEHQRSAAQAVQATRILKQLSPETQLYGVQRSIDSLQRELNDRYKDRRGKVELKIDEDLAKKFMEAQTQEERDEVMKDIYRDIGRQMPSTFMDKWNAWRYLAMLGNVRTHVRNVAGNAFFAPVVAAKDLTATAIESAVYRVSGGKTQRTKGRVSKSLLSAAWADYSKVADTVAGGGKYSDLANANRYIEEGRQIFKTKALEKARKANSAALEAEDAWFSKPHYAFAMAQYCRANGITEAQIRSGKGLDKARAYAAKEAQKATYRDTNQFSELVSNIRFRNPDTTAKKLANIAGEGILPFRKTPANILVRGLEYSPLGLLNGIKQSVWDVQNGKISGAEAIDNIAAGLTGTSLLGLGVYLAAQGLIRGHGGDDDDKREFEEMMGHQAYSLELPNGTSVTLDWLAPEALPFFIGVNLWETTQGEDKDVTLASMLSAASTVAEPLLEMSCLQSLNNAFEAVGYATSNDMSGLETVLSAAATSYLTQALPTILGQAERSTEGTRMTTYTEKNGFLTSDMQYTLGRASSRIPVWDYQQIPYIDAWGRVEDSGGAIERTLNNFLNPAYMSDIDASETESALLALYEQTGDASILPSRARKYFTVDGERKDLTAEEYVVYAQEKGQRSFELVSQLVNSSQFNSMSDDAKVKAIRDAYDLANQNAKAAISDYGVDKWVDKADEAQSKYKIPQETYISLKSKTASIESLKDKYGETIANSRSLLIMQEVYNTPGLSEKQRKALFEYLGVGKSVQHYNKFKVQEELSKMERQAK